MFPRRTIRSRTFASSAASPLALLLGALALAPAGGAQAHGTMTTPASRVYACAQGNIENPADPACRAATAISGTQTFYNWMSIRQGNAAGNHRAVVPDGKLCSGNDPTFAGLDLARDDWQATPVAPDANGRFEFRFRGTAPHATQDWVFYVTRDGWDASKPLAWGDLEEFCRLGNTALSSDGTYHLSCPLPKRSGRHVIYNTWQRSDSPEAFYTCVDVTFGGGTPANQPPVAAFDVAVSGLTVSLTDRSTDRDGTVAARLWSFGDGTTSTLANPSKTFAAAGTYAIQLTATDNAGASSTLARSVTVGATAPVWRDAGALLARNDLPAGTVVTLRVFNADGSDAERIETTLAADDGAAATWPLRVAQAVNARAVRARVGVLDAGGAIVPVASASANHVYLGAVGLTHQLDIRVPTPPPPGQYDYVYPDGIGRYVPGQTVVKASDGRLYACRPWPNGSWCNVNHDAYRPGTGWAWQDAWVLFAPAAKRGATPAAPGPTTSGTTTPAPTAVRRPAASHAAHHR